MKWNSFKCERYGIQWTIYKNSGDDYDGDDDEDHYYYYYYYYYYY